MSLATYIAQRQAQGVANARVIFDEVTRPTVTTSTGKEARPTANLESQLRNLLVPDILSAAVWNNAQPANRDDVIAQRFELRLGAVGQTDAEFIAIARIKARYDLLRTRIERQGGDPTGSDAGKAERDTVTTTQGPALWQTWGLANPPTVKEIREAMR